MRMEGGGGEDGCQVLESEMSGCQSLGDRTRLLEV